MITNLYERNAQSLGHVDIETSGPLDITATSAALPAQDLFSLYTTLTPYSSEDQHVPEDFCDNFHANLSSSFPKVFGADGEGRPLSRVEVAPSIDFLSPRFDYNNILLSSPQDLNQIAASQDLTYAWDQSWIPEEPLQTPARLDNCQPQALPRESEHQEAMTTQGSFSNRCGNRKHHSSMDEQPLMPKKKRTRISHGPIMPELHSIVIVPDIQTSQLFPLSNRTKAQQVYVRLYHKTSHAESKDLLFMTRLYFAIASPEAISVTRCFSCSSTKIRRDCCALHRRYQFNHTSTTLNKIQRRILLMRLFDLRKDRKAYYKWLIDNTLANDEVRAGSVPRRRSSTRTLDELTSGNLLDLRYSAHRSSIVIDTHERKRQILKNWLHNAVNWDRLRKRFNTGILALVPSGGEYRIHNQRFVCLTRYTCSRSDTSSLEYLKSSKFSAFVEILDEDRGEYLREVGGAIDVHVQAMIGERDPPPPYRFETIDVGYIRRQKFDCPELSALFTM